MKVTNLILLFFALMLFACTENQKETTNNTQNGAEISTPRNIESTLIELEVSGNEYISKFRQLFGSDFNIKRMYEYSDDKEMQYIYAVGSNAADNFLISRYSRAKKTGEACKGVLCAECEFPPNGGCACNAPNQADNARCDHSISKEM